MRVTIALAALSALGLATAAAAAPPSWTVVKEQSRIGFSGTHAGNKFDGSFGQWAARIRFDPKDLANSSANVVIGTGSAVTGDNFQETSLKTDEWFDVDKFPSATFTTRKITGGQGGRYLAEGVLTIKNKATPVRLPFTLKTSGNRAQMQGSLSVDRTLLGLGTKSDATGQWVSKTITITINLVANKG